MVFALDSKFKKRYYIIVAISIYAIILTKDFIFAPDNLGAYRVYGSVFIAIYTLILNYFLFKNALFEKFIWWGIYYFGIFIVELLTLGFLVFVLRVSIGEITTNDNVSLWASLCNKILTLLLFEIFIRRRKGKLEIKISAFKNIFILIAFNIILVLGGVAVFSNVGNEEVNLDTVIQFFFVVIFLTTLLTFSLIFKIEKESKKEIETQLKLQQIELELKQSKDMISITDNLRKLRHDMNNHIGLIKSMIYEQKYEDLRGYVDELYQDVAVANEYIVVENKTLSVLLNSKREKAKELEVDFQSFVAASDINMPEKDICVLFGNILDNAIEAASKAINSKFVNMSIQKTESGCIIQCENSIGEKPVIRKGKFLTSKADKNHHGIGTENIIDVVNKYNGKINFDFDEDVFNIRIVMPT
jgi:hypothetical protein